VAGNNSEDSYIHAEGEKGQLGHSGRLKVETDSDPPAVLSTSMCRTTPVAMGLSCDGVPSAGCLARVLSATRGHLGESFSQNIYFDAEILCARKIPHLFLQLKPVQGHPGWVSTEQRASSVTINIGSLSLGLSELVECARLARVLVMPVQAGASSEGHCD
jgi:hypothetical protein